MKKIFLALLVLFSAVLVEFVRARMFVKHEFGPSSMLAAALLVIVILTLAISYFLVDGRHRERLVGFWLISVSTFVTYLLFDLLAGAFLIKPLSPRIVADEIRHHKLVPDAYARFVHQDYSYTQRNNKLGLRGVEVETKKPEFTFRVLMLGDSFTMGKGVSDSQTFSVLLEQKLNEQLKTCNGEFQEVQVLNGGTDSYTPILSYLYLIDSLWALEPDFIIFNLDNSDLIQENVYRRAAIRDGDGLIVAIPGDQSSRWSVGGLRLWIEGNLYFTRSFLFYLNRWLGYKDLTIRGVVTRANTEIVAHTLQSDTIDRTSYWNEIFRSLRLIDGFAVEKNVQFLLTAYPWGHQVASDEWVPGRYTYMTSEDQPIEDYDEQILSKARDVGIDAISVYEAFIQFDGDEKLFFDTDPHFTAAGHRLMADELERQLAEFAILGNQCD